MKDNRKTKRQLLSELAELRQRVAGLEASEAKRKCAKEALRESAKRFQLITLSTWKGKACRRAALLADTDELVVKANLSIALLPAIHRVVNGETLKCMGCL